MGFFSRLRDIKHWSDGDLATERQKISNLKSAAPPLNSYLEKDQLRENLMKIVGLDARMREVETEIARRSSHHIDK